MNRRSLVALSLLSLSVLAACKREESMEDKLRRLADFQRRQTDSVERASIGQPDTTVRMPPADEVRAYRMEMEKVRLWAGALRGVAELTAQNPPLVWRIQARADTLAPTPDQRSQAFHVAQAAEPLMAARIRQAGLEPRDWMMISIKIPAASSAIAQELGVQGGREAGLATPEDVRFLKENQAELTRLMTEAAQASRPF